MTVKRKVHSNVQDLIIKINGDLPEFYKHSYNVYHQNCAFKETEETLKLSEGAILMDFSKNYVCKYAAEVQASHFVASKKQLSLHTGIIYFSRFFKGEKRTICFCTLHEDTLHKAETVLVHLSPIYFF